MKSADAQFKALLEDVIMDGESITTRNSKVKRIENKTMVFGKTPLITLRKTAWKTALREMAFFLSGSDDFNRLHDSVKPWWRPWVDPVTGRLENTYSTQFRNYAGRYGTIDQVKYLLDGTTNHPFSRRLLATTWNTADMVHESTAITTCHGSLIRLSVSPSNALSLTMVQRSCDVMVGLGANLVQYWAFLLWLSHRSKRGVGTFTWIGLDVHLYEAHNELAVKVLTASPQPNPPELVYSPTSEEFLADDFTLSSPYSPSVLEKAEMVV